MNNKIKIIVTIMIVLLAAASRLVKHPFNFTPVAAMALFAGCYLGKKWGVFLPLAAMFVSDIFIGFYDWQVMASVYLAIALAFAIGWYFEKPKKMVYSRPGGLGLLDWFFSGHQFFGLGIF